MPVTSTESSPSDLKNRVLLEVWNHASEDWKHLVDTAIDTFARNNPEFTSEHIWSYLESIGITTHEPRAMGAAFQRAARKGLISKTNRTVAAQRKSRHAGDVRIWNSNVYRLSQ